MQKVKETFGLNIGMSKSAKKKLAEKIIRENGRYQQIAPMQSFMPPMMPQPFNVQIPAPCAFATWQPQPLLPQIGPRRGGLKLFAKKESLILI